MPKGGKFSRRRTTDIDLNAVQDEVVNVLDQLENFRRGILAFPVRTIVGGETLGENTVVVFVGAGPTSVMLPLVSLRGAGVSQWILLVHRGTGNLTVKASGNDTLNSGGSTFVMTNPTGLLFMSDGVSLWVVK